MAIIVSDTSPVRALNHLDKLELFSHLFDAVYIPPAVCDELLQPRRRFTPVRIQQIPNAIVRSPANFQRVQQLRLELDRGESEAIALAEELHVDLLIDEMAGRKLAIRLGLNVTGVVGVLIEAKNRALLPSVMPLIGQLRSELGFFISDRLLAEIRKIVNE
jgi:hypothetical protein